MKRTSPRSVHPELEELRGRFEQFRSVNRRRTRLPEDLWRAAAQSAAERGINLTARILRLDANSLKKWMIAPMTAAKPERVIRKQRKNKPPEMVPAAAFVELLAPSSRAAATCMVEVESVQGGKLRMEVKGLSAREMAELIRTFAGQ